MGHAQVGLDRDDEGGQEGSLAAGKEHLRRGDFGHIVQIKQGVDVLVDLEEEVFGPLDHAFRGLAIPLGLSHRRLVVNDPVGGLATFVCRPRSIFVFKWILVSEGYRSDPDFRILVPFLGPVQDVVELRTIILQRFWL